MATNLKIFIGQVIEIIHNFKAIVEFKLENKSERALLKQNKLKLNGKSLPEGRSLNEYIKMGTLLKFQCHAYDNKGVDRCQWYILSAWNHEEDIDPMSSVTVLRGLHNCTGEVLKLAKRQGFLCFRNNGNDEYVMFLASKLFISGKRVSAKANLDQLQSIMEGQKLNFDAVPCDATDNNNCLWFATVAWKGHKPIMEYDGKNASASDKYNEAPQLNKMKLITSNPHMEYLRSVGQVVKIINEEFGIAIAAIKYNRWETVLFHRSVVTLFDKSLVAEDLTKVFKEGDRLRIVAAYTRKFGVQWVASHIRVYVDPSVRHLFQF